MYSDVFLREKKVLLIDPASPEVNRGSYCYLSYLLASARFDDELIDTVLLEEFTMARLDSVEKYISMGFTPFVALWSYPQIEYAKALYRFFKGKVYFYGYNPLITALGLPIFTPAEDLLKHGMRCYPHNYNRFKNILLSDCDLHLRGVSHSQTDKLYPMFTSYSCSRRCAFCSASANTHGRTVVLELSVVQEMLHVAYASGVRFIHFTDEDFFMDARRAYFILKECSLLGIKCIALASMATLDKFLQHSTMCGSMCADVLKQTVILVEVGLETADENLSAAMNKGSAKARVSPYDLFKMCPVPILWLTVTFFPGETISSLNKTGALMRQIGFAPADVMPRIVTNGTEGGLGQFFQYYDGVTDKTWFDFCEEGLFFTPRATRLSPSYIPDSFVYDEFLINSTELSKRNQVVRFWCDVYGIDFSTMMSCFCCEEQTSYAGLMSQLYKGNTGAFVSIFLEDLAIFIAILARLNVVVPVAKEEEVAHV